MNIVLPLYFPTALFRSSRSSPMLPRLRLVGKANRKNYRKLCKSREFYKNRPQKGRFSAVKRAKKQKADAFCRCSYRLKSLLIFLGVLLLPTTVWATDAIKLRAQVVVDRPVIKLSDVFEGLGTLKDREIAMAPSPGKSVTYGVRVLTNLAKRYALAWKPQSFADKTVLTRAATHITPDMIRDVVFRKVKLAEKKGTKIEIQFDKRVVGLSLAASEEPIFDLTHFDYNRDTQRFRGKVVAQSAGRPIVQSIMGRVAVQRKVPVLAHHLASGDIIGDKDLQWVWMDERRLGEDTLVEISQVVGQELRREQSDGDPLRARDVIPPRLVKRGALVTLKVETPYLLVTTQGRALQDAALGETVRVTNTQSSRVIEGVVDRSGVVHVGTLRKIASVQ